MSQLSGAQNPSDRSMSSTDAERADLLETLAKHRSFLRFTVQGLTDEQAAQRTTVSELCLGGLLKHVCRRRGEMGRLHRAGRHRHAGK